MHFYVQQCIMLRIFIVGNCIVLSIENWHKTQVCSGIKCLVANLLVRECRLLNYSRLCVTTD